MNLVKRITLVACVLVIGVGATFAGLNPKEVGALLIYPEYWATDPMEDPGAMIPDVDTYITITNDKNARVSAHIEVIDKEFCGDCNFNIELTAFQSKRLRLDRQQTGLGNWTTVIEDASATAGPEKIVGAACPGKHGFVVVSLEDPDIIPAHTLGQNMLHGDEVVLDITNNTAVQVGAIAVQGVGPNNHDRHYDFNNMEYAAFPDIITGNFWAANPNVAPRLILFNVNFETGQVPPPTTNCSINAVNAEEVPFSAFHNFGCWDDPLLSDIAAGFEESELLTANGFFWAQCETGTHGALLTTLASTAGMGPYPYPNGAFKDTLFQSTTTDPSAQLWLTPDLRSPGGPPGPPNQTP